MATDQHGSYMATDQPVTFCDGSIYTHTYIYIYIWRRASACETRKICSILFFRIWVCRDSISASFWKGKYSFVFSETISCHVIENVFWSFPDVFNNGLYRGVLVRNNIMFFRKRCFLSFSAPNYIVVYILLQFFSWF